MAQQGVTSQIFLFDMETTGLSRKIDQVCQLSAIPFDIEHTSRPRTDIFNEYVLPSCEFNPMASQINGFYINNTGELCKQGRPLPTVSVKEAYSSFFEYLKQKTPPKASIMLTGYNCKSFDTSFLKRDCHEHGISIAVEGRELHFADAYLLIKAVKRTSLPGIRSLRQQAVHQYLYPHSRSFGESHDGVKDVFELADILRFPKIPLDKLLSYKFDLS